jgi:hypothetical protein
MNRAQALISAVVFLIMFAAASCEDRKRQCVDKGGRVETTCHDEWHCDIYPVGDGAVIPICGEQEFCDWQCVDLPPEDPRPTSQPCPPPLACSERVP